MTTGCQGVTVVLMALGSWKNLHPCPWGFFIGRRGELQGLVQGIYSSIVGLIAAVASGFKAYCLLLGGGLLG